MNPYTFNNKSVNPFRASAYLSVNPTRVALSLKSATVVSPTTGARTDLP